MTDFLNIGPSPANEECVQVGVPNYRDKAKREMSHFIFAIREKCGEEPEGAQLVIKWFPHDSGTYGEVCCKFDPEIEEAVEYAYKVESEAPTRWDQTEVKRPRFDDDCFVKEELIPVPEKPYQWLSEIPGNCDLSMLNLQRTKPCDIEIKNEFIDGATIFGPWANMCPTCHAQFGTGLGLGLGQRYRKAVDGNFYKVE